MIHFAAVAAFLVYLCLTAPAEAFTEVRSIPTRTGVMLEFLYASDTKDIEKNALILFTGGNGASPYRLTENGAIHGWNFLVRSAGEYIKRGFTAIAVSPPSDYPNGMGADFRESVEHARDIALLMDYLEQQGAERIFLMGNSRGTLSVAAIAAQVRHRSLAGIVLTSTLEYSEFMGRLPLEKIRVPVLMVHHKDDACRVSSLAQAFKTRDQLRKYTSVTFVEVDSWVNPMSPPCSDLSLHGFFKMEDKVVPVIGDWISGRQVPERIEIRNY